MRVFNRELALPPTILVLFCLGLLVWAGLRANAAWHYIAAQSIAEPLFAASGGDVAAFDESERHIRTALRRLPGNPDYHDFAGKLAMIKANQPGVVGVERRALLESAAGNFRQALAVRPLWPYSWVNLLAAKDKLGQVDMEFNNALQRAAATGPWEPQLMLWMIDIGIHNWSVLKSSERTLIQNILIDALRVRPRQVFAIVKSYARPDLICGKEGGYRQISHWCESAM